MSRLNMELIPIRINSSHANKLLYPVLLEDKNIKISKMIIKNTDHKSVQFENQVIYLQELQNGQIVVSLTNRRPM